MEVTSVEIAQTRNGAPFKKVKLDTGNTFNLFKFHSRYDEINIGTQINADELEPHGRYLNLRDLKQVGTSTPGQGAPRYGGGQREEAISRAQDKKEESIAYFNATNAAIEMVKIMGIVEEKVMQEYLVVWRDWFLTEWKRHRDGDKDVVVSTPEDIGPEDIPF